MDNNTMSNQETHSASSVKPETENSDKTGLQKGIILHIPPEEANEDSGLGKQDFPPSEPFHAEVYGEQDDYQNDEYGNTVHEKTDKVYSDSVGDIQLNDQLKHTASKHNGELYNPIYTTRSGNQSAASTPVKQRSRAESRVSFAEVAKVSIFNRMDSIPAYESFCGGLVSLRWQVALMCCLISSLTITVRQCMSMAIVCMSGLTTDFPTNSSQENATLVTPSTETNKYQLQWDIETQGLVLSSYYYTFPFTPLLGGFLAGKFGGKWVIFSEVMLMCAVSFSIPFVAFIHPAAVMVARAVVGFSSGGLMPATVQLLSRWAPQLERSRMLAIVNSGQSIGNILTFLSSGFICMIPFQGGWPFIFYIFSGLTFLAIVLWAFVVYDSPEVHPKASIKEVLYILDRRRSSTARMPSPPWRKILTSGPFWAILIAHTSHGFIFTVIGTFLPLYMKDVLKYDPTTNGVLSSLPFIGRLIGAFSVGILADKCLQRKLFSTGTTRKLLQCIGMIGSAPFLIALSYLTAERRTLVVALLTCYWTMQSTTNAAFRVNHLDIAPTFAGVINGITLTCASIAALVAPVVTAAITTNGSREEWQIVFFICAGLGIFGAIIFCVLGSGEEENWAKDPNLDIERDISQESTECPSPAENYISNGDTSGFMLGGKRRSSSQKSLVSVASDSLMGINNNAMDDLTDFSLEKRQNSLENDSNINDANENPFSNQPVYDFNLNFEKHCGSKADLKTIPSSPISPTLSYSSYGFSSTTTDPIAKDLELDSQHKSFEKTTMQREDIEETDTKNKTAEGSSPVQNRNHKNLVLILSKNDSFCECTHL